MLLKTPFVGSTKHIALASLRQAGFASQFTKLERNIEQIFDPSAYKLPRTDESLLVAQPWT